MILLSASLYSIQEILGLFKVAILSSILTDYNTVSYMHKTWNTININLLITRYNAPNKVGEDIFMWPVSVYTQICL